MCQRTYELNKDDLVIRTDEELNLLEVTFKERKVSLGVTV